MLVPSDLCDQFAARFVPLAVGGPLALLRYDSFPCGAVLQRELADDPAELGDFDVAHRVGWLTQVQNKGVEPVEATNHTSCYIVLVTNQPGLFIY